jgi:hypothetical protein
MRETRGRQDARSRTKRAPAPEISGFAPKDEAAWDHQALLTENST